MGARLVTITLLAAIGFYNYHNMFSLPLKRAMFMMMIIICACVAIREKTSLSSARFPRWLWFLFIIGLFVSVFNASFYHPQSITSSIIVSSTNIFTYLFLFVLIKLNPDPEQLFKYLYCICGCSLLVFLANFATFPNNIFGEPMLEDMSRGMLRVPFTYLEIVLLMTFYTINQWQLKRKTWMFIFIGIGIMCILLSLTRQIIAIMAVLCFFQILYNLSFWKKIAIGMVLLAGGYIILSSLPFYRTMVELSEEQIDENPDKENVRIGAWRYYAYEGTEDIVPLLFGNGTPSAGKSIWGKQFESYTEETGHFASDVSWAGSIFINGYVTTAILLAIVLMAIFKKKRPDQQYLTYFFICVLLQGIASGVWFYYTEIAVIMVAFYLLYRKNDNYTPDNSSHIGESTTRRLFITK